ncbi:effector-associated domain EAD1-containing protein [Dactylosporangium sp. NPDC049742]|uniref:effector-associated domain EAD1-containing protein n=1 Tax=Dactylosporangium sp. NPDC049742 TaxID=3154737 RepID=UPI00342B6A96
MTYQRIAVTGPQQLAIRDALVAAFPDPDSVEELLMLLDRTFTLYQGTGKRFVHNIRAVVSDAAVKGWLPELLERAAEQVPDEELRRLRDELRPAAVAVAADPFVACRLAGGYVMVDREGLRAALRELDRPTGRRILAVGGAPRSGKSHTIQLIRYLSLMRGNFQLFAVDLEDIVRAVGQGTQVTPYHLARSIVKKLGYGCVVADPPTDAQWSAWVGDFCDDFEPFAMADERSPWLVIDAFNSVVAMQATLDLVLELARRIDRGIVGLRLVLIGYPEPLTVVRQQVAFDELCAIGVREVLQFFADAYQQLGLTATDETLHKLTTGVLRDLDADAEYYLRTLGERASQALVDACEAA